MKTVIIILGAARSGSTLLAKAIGGHSKCFALGEINRFNKEINDRETPCGCAKKLDDCDFWNNVLTKLQTQIGTKIRGEKSFNMGIFNQLTSIKKIQKLIPTVILKTPYRNKVVDQEIENTLTLYDMLFKETKTNVLIDSSKGLFRALVLASRSAKDINFKFIQLTRDGRGVLNSSLKSSYSVIFEDRVLEQHKDNYKTPKKVINSWLYINLRNFIILKIFRGRKSIFIKYENFTSNPAIFLRKVYENVNLEYEESALDLGKNENHIMGGNSSRINAKKIKKQDDAWRINLDKELLRKFNWRAGWFNRLLGY